MDFRFSDEQLGLRDAIGALCVQHFDLATVAGREGQPVAPATWNALADMGLFALLLPDEPGGLVEAAIMFEQLGADVASGPLLWSTIAAPLLPDAERIGGVIATTDEPVVIEHAAEIDTLVIVYDDRVEQCAASDLPAPIAASPFDPLTPAAAYAAVPTGETIGGPDDAQALRLSGTVLAAAMLVGVAQGALDVATNYALERKQFDVPIGSFQAIKHLLADAYVRVELARAATYAAAALGDPRSASTAKLLAGEAGIANGRTAVQVLGGMGFTWEMLPHYYLKRAWVLEQSFGTADSHALALSAWI